MSFQLSFTLYSSITPLAYHARISQVLSYHVLYNKNMIPSQCAEHRCRCMTFTISYPCKIVFAVCCPGVVVMLALCQILFFV